MGHKNSIRLNYSFKNTFADSFYYIYNSRDMDKRIAGRYLDSNIDYISRLGYRDAPRSVCCIYGLVSSGLSMYIRHRGSP